MKPTRSQLLALAGLCILATVVGVQAWSSANENLDRCGNYDWHWNGHSCCARGQGCWFPEWRREELQREQSERLRSLSCEELQERVSFGLKSEAMIGVLKEKGCWK